MTLHASREGQKIHVHGNIGVDLQVHNSQVSSVRITEDAVHVKHFAGQLLRLVEEAEHELAAAQSEAAAATE